MARKISTGLGEWIESIFIEEGNMWGGGWEKGEGLNEEYARRDEILKADGDEKEVRRRDIIRIAASSSLLASLPGYIIWLIQFWGAIIQIQISLSVCLSIILQSSIDSQSTYYF